jgi:hypothetical protein
MLLKRKTLKASQQLKNIWQLLILIQMKNKHLVALNKIKRKIDCDCYRIEDFIEVCPFTVEELKKPNRLPIYVNWRFTGILWNLLCGMKEGNAAEYFGRDRTNVANVLEKFDQAMIGWNEALLSNLRIVAAHSRTKPTFIPKVIVPVSVIIKLRRKRIDPRKRIWNLTEKYENRQYIQNESCWNELYKNLRKEIRETNFGTEFR